MLTRATWIGLAAAALLAAGPALAQKSKDTLRVAINDPVGGLSPYDFALDEVAPHYRTIYRALLNRDEHTDTWVPELAASWTRVNPTTLDFTLRDDVTFHSGNHFSADDVVYTINDYILNPKFRFRGKPRFRFIKEAEKLGPYKVRIKMVKPDAADLAGIAYLLYIIDSKVHKGLEHSSDYGIVSASGTGPYRMKSIDRRGFVLERFDGYKGNPNYAAKIREVQGISMPDRQTQIAQLLTGGLEVARDIEADTARELKADPKVDISTVGGLSFVYLMIDAAGRSDFKPTQDLRVRKAIVMAIDREKIRTALVPGGAQTPRMDRICFPAMIACAGNNAPYPYNPKRAKELLAEAGYANGFDMPVFVHSPIRQVGEAVANELREIGIRTTMQALPISLYVRMRNEGKLTTFVGIRPVGGFPDMSFLMDSFYNAGRDYWHDPVMKEIRDKGIGVMDTTARAKMYARAMDRTNELAYILPISQLPTLLAHDTNVALRQDPLYSGEYLMTDFSWK